MHGRCRKNFCLQKSSMPLAGLVYFHMYISAIHAAALAGHAVSVKLLLQNGGNVNIQDQLQHTPLFRACEMGHTGIILALYI